MHTLPGLWHAVAALSGRVDLSMLYNTVNVSDTVVQNSSIKEKHRVAMRTARELHSPQPFIRYNDDRFPELLKPLPFAPGVLFFLGDPTLLHEPCVAIVGARKCTGRGRRFAEQLSANIVDSGLVTVSGLAYGIDQAVHMIRPNRTIAVLGQGIESALNSSKRRLIHKITEAGGLVVSEFLPYRPPNKSTFPMRNRVISGLSSGTVVIEAGLRSGSLITANQALEHGRELMVVPGHPTDPLSEGCNKLLMNGAAAIRNSTDVLEVLGRTAEIAEPRLPVDAAHRAIIDALNSGDTIDHIVSITGCSIEHASIHIAELELTGWVSRLPGERLCLRRPS